MSDMRTTIKLRSLGAVLLSCSLSLTACNLDGAGVAHGDQLAQATPDRAADGTGAATATPTVTPTAPAAGPSTTPPPAPATTVDTESRLQYSEAARARLERLDGQIEDLRAQPKGSSAAAELTAERDRLSRQIDSAGTAPGTAWDQFRTDIGRAFDELEADVDRRLSDPVR